MTKMAAERVFVVFHSNPIVIQLREGLVVEKTPYAKRRTMCEKNVRESHLSGPNDAIIWVYLFKNTFQISCGLCLWVPVWSWALCKKSVRMWSQLINWCEHSTNTESCFTYLEMNMSTISWGGIIHGIFTILSEAPEGRGVCGGGEKTQCWWC